MNSDVLNFKDVLSLTSNKIGLISAYYLNRRVGINHNATFEQYSSKASIKTMFNSNENENGGTIIAIDGDITYFVTETKNSFLIARYNGVEETNTWSEKTIAKALSVINAARNSYYVSLNSTTTYRTNRELADMEKVRNSNEGSNNLYMVSKHVRAQLESMFDTSLISTKERVKTLAENDDYLEVRKVMQKIIYSSTYRNITPRNVELTDILDMSYNNNIRDRIEKQPDVTISEYYGTSDLKAIRIAGAKTLKQAKETITTFFN